MLVDGVINVPSTVFYYGKDTGTYVYKKRIEKIDKTFGKEIMKYFDTISGINYWVREVNNPQK